MSRVQSSVTHSGLYRPPGVKNDLQGVHVNEKNYCDLLDENEDPRQLIYPLLKNIAIKVVIAFSSSYLAEEGFRTVSPAVI